MVGEHHEAAIEQPFLAGEDRLHDGFEVVVDHALRHAAEEGEGLVVRVEDHFLGFPGIGHDEHLSAEGQAEMREFDGLDEAAEFDLLMAPIELADLAGCEGQWDKGLGERGAGFMGFPALDEALHAVIGAAIALGLQAFEQAARGAALGFWQQAFGLQPILQSLLEGAEPGGGLLGPAIDRFGLGPAVLANRGPGEVQITRDRTDALLAHGTAKSNFGNQVHDQHPRISSAKAG